MDKAHILDPDRHPEPSEMMLHNLYELYFPSQESENEKLGLYIPPREAELYRDAELYNEFSDWPEWVDPI